MAIAGLVLVVLAGIATLVFGVQVLVRAFKTSLAWGLASLFVPSAVLVFVVKHWPQAKVPFLRSLACLPVGAVGFALMVLGGGASLSIVPFTRGEAAAPATPPRVETATYVLRTVEATQDAADVASLQPCTESLAGTTVLTPKELAVCAYHSDPFEAGKVQSAWVTVSKDDDFFGQPLSGQWASWLLISKKGTGEYVDLVTIQLLSVEDGRISLECDADRSSRSQESGGAGRRDDYREACDFVSEKLGVGVFLYNWNRARPAIRFASKEGPTIDLRLVRFR